MSGISNKNIGDDFYSKEGADFWGHALNIVKNCLAGDIRTLNTIIPKNNLHVEYYFKQLIFLNDFLKEKTEEVSKELYLLNCTINAIITDNSDKIAKGSATVELFYDYVRKLSRYYISNDVKKGYNVIDELMHLLNNKDNYLTVNYNKIKAVLDSLKIIDTVRIEDIMEFVKNGDIVGLKDYIMKLFIDRKIINDDISKLREFMRYVESLDEKSLDKTSKEDVDKETLKELPEEITLPEIKQLDDIYKYKDQIIKYVKQFRNVDHVYMIKNKGRHEYGTYRQGTFEVSSQFYVAGSAALLKISEYLIEKFKMNLKRFSPGDTDIFVINNDKKFRSNFGNTDIVYTRDKSIEDLLLNFDLPCCRVATNPNGDYWISIQCMYALLTGKYYLPKYLHLFQTFYPLIEKYPGETLKKVSSDVVLRAVMFLHNRLMERIKKYSTRGFNLEFYETETILPWIIHRLDYSEPTSLLDHIR